MQLSGLLTTALAGLLLAGCGGGGPAPTPPADGGLDLQAASDGATGGTAASGGASGTGGAGSGGSAGPGGASATGGTSSSGGTPATGGSGGAAVGGGGSGGGAHTGGTSGNSDAGTGGGMASDAGAPDAPIDSAVDVALGTDAPPLDGAPTSGAVDIVFLVDDSYSMAPLQASLARAFSGFIDTLQGLPGGLPSLHIGVITSSLGAGVFGNVTGCAPGTVGNRDGAFVHPATCTALPASERFLIADGAVKNFIGDISQVFGCLAMTGATGCGFEQQFASTKLALEKAMTVGDPENAGFLRPNAHLALIMLTNEDDCSVPPDSLLFDPNQQSLADPLGGLQSYRCNEFGHLCGGVAPPHQPPATPVTFDSCVPAESQGRLTLVSDFIAFVKGLKSSPDKVFVAAMAGPVTPYAVESKMFMLGNGGVEVQPQVRHSCSNPSGTYADPAVRVKTWVDAFGTNGVFESLCPDDLGPPMMRIAQALSASIRR